MLKARFEEKFRTSGPNLGVPHPLPFPPVDEDADHGPSQPMRQDVSAPSFPMSKYPGAASFDGGDSP